MKSQLTTVLTRQEEVYRIIATNVLGTATVTRCALRFLRPQGFGVIANFGSLTSWEGGLAYGYYVRDHSISTTVATTLLRATRVREKVNY